MFIVFGSNFGTSQSAASNTPLSIELAGKSLTINNRVSPLIYVNSIQVNAQVPFEILPGAATLVVSNATTGLSSVPASIFVLPSAPGIFTDGQNNAIAQNQDSSLNMPNNGAGAGSVVTLYMTGQGPLDIPVPSGSAAAVSPLSRVTLPVRATIGEQNAKVLFAGMTPGSVGLLQLNLVIPALSPGQYPIAVTVGSTRSNGPPRVEERYIRGQSNRDTDGCGK